MAFVPSVITRLAAFAAAGGCVAGLLSGCTSGQDTSAPAPTTAGRSRAVGSAEQKYARCVREHGLPNFPDLVYSDQTHHWVPPPGAPTPSSKTMDTCRALAGLALGKSGDDLLSPAYLKQLRAFARCMRANGLADWPDPGPTGAFPLPSHLLRGGKTLFGRQLRACRKDLPSTGGIVVSRNGTDNGS